MILIAYLTGICYKSCKNFRKKEQRVEGSVETKLWSCIALKREYELVLGSDYTIYYGFCLNNFLKKKITSQIPKYMNFNIIVKEHNIKILFGDDDDYINKLNEWINNSL